MEGQETVDELPSAGFYTTRFDFCTELYLFDIPTLIIPFDVVCLASVLRNRFNLCETKIN